MGIEGTPDFVLMETHYDNPQSVTGKTHMANPCLGVFLCFEQVQAYKQKENARCIPPHPSPPKKPTLAVKTLYDQYSHLQKNNNLDNKRIRPHVIERMCSLYMCKPYTSHRVDLPTI